MELYPLESRFGSPYGLPSTRNKYVFGALIGGVLGLAAAMYSSSRTESTSKYASDKAYRAQQETNSFNAQQAEIQRNWSQAMVREQNAYNSPSAQVERYKAAGLNPYAAMAQGSINSGAQTSLPEYETPQISAEGYIQSAQILAQGVQAAEQQRMQGLQLAIDSGVKVANLLQSSAQTAKTRAETQFMKDSWHTNLESLKMQLNGFYLDNVRKQIENQGAELQLSIQQKYGMKLAEVELENGWEDFRNKVADTGIKGITAEKLRKDIDEVSANIALKLVQTAGAELDNENKVIQNEIQQSIKQYLIERAKAESEAATYQTSIAKSQSIISEIDAKNASSFKQSRAAADNIRAWTSAIGALLGGAGLK